MAYTLAEDGDGYEKQYFNRFIRDEFPSYDAFWVKHVVPLTNRPADVHFKTKAQLGAEGKGDHEVCIAQLHYTVLRHLAKVHEIRHVSHVSIEDLTEGMVRLSGAQDVAFELLERYTNPGAYDPWLSRGSGGRKGSKEARQAWQKNENYPLQGLRDYRNHLVHGRVSPSVIVNGVSYVPALGREAAYFDWREVTQHPNPGSLVNTDLVLPERILEDGWSQTVDYFEDQWKKRLL